MLSNSNATHYLYCVVHFLLIQGYTYVRLLYLGARLIYLHANLSSLIDYRSKYSSLVSDVVQLHARDYASGSSGSKNQIYKA